MEFKRPIESTVLFGERGGAVNLIEDNKDRRYRVSIVSNQGKTSWGRVENQQLKTNGVESGIKPETLRWNATAVATANPVIYKNRALIGKRLVEAWTFSGV